MNMRLSTRTETTCILEAVDRPADTPRYLVLPLTGLTATEAATLATGAVLHMSIDETALVTRDHLGLPTPPP
jgi:hypothetical protein